MTRTVDTVEMAREAEKVRQTRGEAEAHMKASWQKVIDCRFLVDDTGKKRRRREPLREETEALKLHQESLDAFRAASGAYRIWAAETDLLLRQFLVEHGIEVARSAEKSTVRLGGDGSIGVYYGGRDKPNGSGCGRIHVAFDGKILRVVAPGNGSPRRSTVPRISHS